ncbi:hypothetical protein CHUAL_013903 [Chamberlinius hualienensis]
MAEGCGITCLKYTLFFLNFAAWLIGVTILGMAIWILADQDMREFVEAMEFEYYYTSMYILVAVGFLVIVVGFLGCCGSITENICMIQAFFFIMIIVFIMELTAAIYLLVVGISTAEVDANVSDRMYRMLNDYNNDDVRWAMDTMQETMECCGVMNSYDYDNVNLPVPDSCRDPTTGNNFEDGCMEAFQEFFNTKSGVIAGLALLIACLHVAAIIMAACLCTGLKREMKLAV